MKRPNFLALALLTLLLIALGSTGCGVKGDPTPYVHAYPERAPKAEAEEKKEVPKP